MLFNSLAFVFFLPIVLLLYWKVFGGSKKQQNYVLLFSSYFFYGCWNWRFLILIILSSLIDYTIGKKIFDTNLKKKRKNLLLISLVCNLGILVFFKYFNFFAESLEILFHSMGVQLSGFTLSILLPIGISFYTLQTISYTVDIYRGKLEPSRNWLSFFTFVAFFPQLVAGPIERAIKLVPQFYVKRKFDWPTAVSGLRQALWGLFKKVVVADTLAQFVNHVYNAPEAADVNSFVVAALFFSIQVYCDFSGYSDIAIGIAKLFNIQLTENFKTPFFSQSMKEFWNRWHISLSTWFRDYVYIPLGGNRTGPIKMYQNLFWVMLISGLRHGASWNFVIWGACHGILLITEVYLEKRNFLSKPSNPQKWRVILNRFYTFMAFTITLILFRANTFQDVFTLTGTFFSDTLQWSAIWQQLVEVYTFKIDLLFIGLSLLLLAAGDYCIRHSTWDQFLGALQKPTRLLLYTAVVIWIFTAGTFDDPQEFVYFQF